MFNILLVEDDTNLLEILSRFLSKNNYSTFSAHNVREAYNYLENEFIDLIISDVMMPDINGFDFIRDIRASQYNMPVMFITAKSDYIDKEEGFNAGADDYMVKPVDLNEMNLRIGALLRRAKSSSEQKLTFGKTTLEYGTWSVIDGSGTQTLPQKEFMLIYKLLSYPGKIFTRQQILDDIWGIEEVADSHTLDVHISRLRERFRDNEDFKIETIRGLGYKAVKKQS